MSHEIEAKIEKIPVVRSLMHVTKGVKLPWLHDMTLYDLVEMYLKSVVEGGLPNKANSIAFSFFMALFPFTLFILNLIPYIPIEGFQQDFMDFLAENVPPQTFGAISNIISDILHNSYESLLSTGIILAIVFQANGLNAILSGFESSHHIEHKRGFFSQYLVSIGISLILSILLFLTIIVILVFQIFIQSTQIQDIFGEDIGFLENGRYAFVILMLLFGTSILFRYGTKQVIKRKFISIGSVFTTILFIISSYGFGIWVVNLSNYNKLYGSIGTLLILMFYIWLNCLILLLGFELDALISKLKIRYLDEKTQLNL